MSRTYLLRRQGDYGVTESETMIMKDAWLINLDELYAYFSEGVKENSDLLR